MKKANSPQFKHRSLWLDIKKILTNLVPIRLLLDYGNGSGSSSPRIRSTGVFSRSLSPGLQDHMTLVTSNGFPVLAKTCRGRKKEKKKKKELGEALPTSTVLEYRYRYVCPRAGLDS